MSAVGESARGCVTAAGVSERDSAEHRNHTGTVLTKYIENELSLD